MRALTPEEVQLIAGGYDTAVITVYGTPMSSIPYITVFPYPLASTPISPVNTNPDGRCQYGNKANFDVIAQHEGGNFVNAYVGPGPNSGVTVAVGFDLGQHSVSDLQNLGHYDLGIDQNLINLVTPYLGLQGQSATNYLSTNPLTITDAQSAALNNANFQWEFNSFAANYDQAVGSNAFENLPAQTQTAILDLVHQYGTNLSARTPQYWGYITSRNWSQAVTELNYFGDAFTTRRKDEANMIQTDQQLNALPSPGQGC